MKAQTRPSAKRVNRPTGPGSSGELVEPSIAEKGITTFSIRLTEDQRQLIARAAELRGWTPSRLIRTATLERAAQIVNTSQITSFPFKSLASSVAEKLFKGQTVMRQLSDEEYKELSAQSPALPCDVPPLPLGDLFKLKRAARLGGPEFLNLIVEYAESVTAGERQDLPEPVDPGLIEL